MADRQTHSDLHGTKNMVWYGTIPYIVEVGYPRPKDTEPLCALIMLCILKYGMVPFVPEW